MKPVKLFFLKTCPYCKQAFEIMESLRRQDKYKAIEVELIEESEQPQIANRYDYYYVPTFYVDEVKQHEGAVTPEAIEKVFRLAIEEE